VGSPWYYRGFVLKAGRRRIGRSEHREQVTLFRARLAARELPMNQIISEVDEGRGRAVERSSTEWVLTFGGGSLVVRLRSCAVLSSGSGGQSFVGSYAAGAGRTGSTSCAPLGRSITDRARRRILLNGHVLTTMVTCWLGGGRLGSWWSRSATRAPRRSQTCVVQIGHQSHGASPGTRRIDRDRIAERVGEEL